MAFKLLPYLIILIAGLSVSYIYGGVLHGKLDHRLLSLVGIAFFAFAGVTALNVASSQVRQSIISHRLGVGRAAALQFVIRVFGYLFILFVTVGRIGIPLGHLLLGSAVVGIILGVAAQQALANFFASIVLIVVHPFTVGQRITLVSGALGGKYVGTVDDIGLTHTSLAQDDGSLVRLPNATILSGAAVTVHKRTEHVKSEKP